MFNKSMSKAPGDKQGSLNNDVLLIEEGGNYMALEIKSFKAKDGAELKYVDVGSGKPFLYIYGMGSSIESQTPFIEAMSEKGRIICFDQRAFGITPAQGQMGIDQSARDAQDLLDYLGIEKTVIFGYSMGGAAVFSYLEQFGCGRIEKVLIGDMSPKLISEGDWKLGLYQGWYTREMYEQDLKDISGGNYKHFALILSEQILLQHTPDEVRDFTGTDDEIRARITAKRNDLIAQVLFANLVDLSDEHIEANYYYWQTMASADFRPVLKNITVPVGLLHAVPGSIYNPETQAYMAGQIPDATLMPMENCTHMAAGEDPVKWRKYITDFVF